MGTVARGAPSAEAREWAGAMALTVGPVACAGGWATAGEEVRLLEVFKEGLQEVVTTLTGEGAGALTLQTGVENTSLRLLPAFHAGCGECGLSWRFGLEPGLLGCGRDGEDLLIEVRGVLAGLATRGGVSAGPGTFGGFLGLATRAAFTGDFLCALGVLLGDV